MTSKIARADRRVKLALGFALVVFSLAQTSVADRKSPRQKDPELEAACTRLQGHALEVSYFIETDSLNYESCQQDAIPDGETRTYYENGAPRSAGSFAQGLLTGNWMRWYTNGNKMDEGSWEKGKPVGLWKSYYSSGKPKEIFKYETSGERCTLKSWNDQGTSVRSTHPCKPEVRQASLKHFALHELSLFQGNSGQYNTVELGWTPELGLNQRFFIHGILGAFSLYYRNTNSHFVGIEAAGLLQYQNSPRMSLALGPGIQVFTDTDKTAGAELVAEISYYNKPGNFLDRIFLGVSELLHMPTGSSSISTNVVELKVGVGI